MTLRNPKGQHHRFWDRTNIALFAGAAAARAADLDSTWRFRSGGCHEGRLSDRLVDNKPAFTAYSFGLVGANIGLSWWLHRRGHHRLERLVTAVHLGETGTAAVRNYRLRCQGM